MRKHLRIVHRHVRLPKKSERDTEYDGARNGDPSRRTGLAQEKICSAENHAEACERHEPPRNHVVADQAADQANEMKGHWRIVVGDGAVWRSIQRASARGGLRPERIPAFVVVAWH
jgi:hypothetical protein